MNTREIKKKIAQEKIKGCLPEWFNQYVKRSIVIKTIKGEVKQVELFVFIKFNNDGKQIIRRVFKDWKLYKDRTDWEEYTD